ncbi:MAG TPA: hypothetical protein VKR52_04495 [Terracidiphilus sp.]|nr:hypothetical protein [Terracidiphilus sp.]
MNIQEVDQPEEFDGAHDWEEVLLGPIVINCVPTHKTLKDYLSEDDGRRFHDGGDWDERSGYEDERTVDAVVGVGDEPESDE